MRARQASAREPAPVALAGVVRRNRRRYGGYVVHAGFAVLLLGVAVSSSFQHAEDVTLRPGQTARVDGFDIRYVRATARAESEKISLGAVLDVSKDGKQVATLRTTRGFYPSQDVSQGIVGRFFGGESESEVGLRAGFGRDIWTVINPNLAPLTPIIERGNRTFRRAMVGIMGKPGGNQQQAVTQLYALRDAAVDRGRAALRDLAVAGRLPLHRLAARDVDLDRRDHHVPRRPARAVAGARHRATPCDGRLRGARRARAGADDAVRTVAWSC